MGTWSRPLLTRCYDAAGVLVPPADVRLTLSPTDMSRPWVLKLVNHGMLSETAATLTFDEAVMSTCDTAKIWGYLDSAEYAAWVGLGEALFAANPTVAEAQAHFLCTDATMPYAIVVCRSADVTDEAPATSVRYNVSYARTAPALGGVAAFALYGSRNHALYTTVRLDAAAGDGASLLSFSDAAYAAAVDAHPETLWNEMQAAEWPPAAVTPATLAMLALTGRY
jgi:hypothetical protein